jgi:hypothetical protein
VYNGGAEMAKRQLHKLSAREAETIAPEAAKARALLQDVGYNRESRANKIALPINAETRDKIASMVKGRRQWLAL